MKLEIRHLAPYLPYKLLLAKEGFPHVELQGLNVHTDYSYWKPILRPLSDLTKSEFRITFLNNLKYDNFLITQGSSVRINRYPYYVIEWLTERHFDIFGLIEAGLAIDINTLDPV